MYPILVLEIIFLLAHNADPGSTRGGTAATRTLAQGIVRVTVSVDQCHRCGPEDHMRHSSSGARRLQNHSVGKNRLDNGAAGNARHSCRIVGGPMPIDSTPFQSTRGRSRPRPIPLATERSPGLTFTSLPKLSHPFGSRQGGSGAVGVAFPTRRVPPCDTGWGGRESSVARGRDGLLFTAVRFFYLLFKQSTHLEKIKSPK